MKLTERQFRVIQNALETARLMFETYARNLELSPGMREHFAQQAAEAREVWELNENGQLLEVG